MNITGIRGVLPCLGLGNTSLGGDQSVAALGLEPVFTHYGTALNSVFHSARSLWESQEAWEADLISQTLGDIDLEALWQSPQSLFLGGILLGIIIGGGIGFLLGRWYSFANLDKTMAHLDKEKAHLDKALAYSDKEKAHLDKALAHSDEEKARLDKAKAHLDKEAAALEEAKPHKKGPKLFH